MNAVEILQATLARAAQRSLDFCPNAVHSRLQLRASSPDGPAAPWVWSEATQMDSAVMLSNMVGWKPSSSMSV